MPPCYIFSVFIIILKFSPQKITPQAFGVSLFPIFQSDLGRFLPPPPPPPSPASNLPRFITLRRINMNRKRALPSSS
ncbi:hypothetical protein NC652_032033 [Populus alba x Populus x berolinensis]|nr:hypothetical protein NC652_032033 [Populus alba x Populus x berolinensis]